MNGAALALVERGVVPDPVVRAGIRRLIRRRLRDDVPADPGARRKAVEEVVRAMSGSPVAVATDEANEQHYEVPPDFFRTVLGPRLKYSSCLWPDGTGTLEEAEEAMLALTCERADLCDGQQILELGCGWGSLTLWMAERYPSARIVAVSNSAPQRRYIEGRAAEAGLANVRVVTADVNDFSPPQPAVFDRVVSVEMFEHVRNWRELLGRVTEWLASDGRLFLHYFCHAEVPYFFEAQGEDDWMARHFFTGGMMPSRDLAGRISDALEVEEEWTVGGLHYARTARAWLEGLDAHRDAVEELFRAAPGPPGPRRRAERWRLFFMAVEELFAWREGREWMVAHVRMRHAAG